MAREYEPVAGQWYENIDENESFRVLSVDEDSELIEIEYLDGELEELDLDSWQELDLEKIEQPEGWSASDKAEEEEEEDEMCIRDRAALATHPANAWLILACDLPFLGEDTLEYLILHRASARLATAFRSRSDGLPEPLCAIYEPASRDAIEAWIKAGERCPRAWMRRSDVALIELPDARALDNVNTSAEYAAASAALRERRRLNVRYFALLREQAGRRCV